MRVGLLGAAILPLVLGISGSHGQVVPSDTSSALRTDTTTAAQDTIKSPSGVDTVVTYLARDSVLFFPSTKVMSMYGSGDIKYRELGLKAERIDIDWNTSTLLAEGVADTTDSTGVRGKPDLIDGSDEYHGTKISYNFRSQKGKVTVAETKIDDGLYYGTSIKKVESDVLFIENGRYTTCELESPHFFVRSPEMKVVVQDQVVARPVYLYVSDVPVFWLPFGVFPNQRGRRSGLIAPSYGTEARGRFLENLGYYWAMSDFTDLAVRTNLYTGGSWRLFADFRYALKYSFSGSLNGFYGKDIFNEPTDPDYSTSQEFGASLVHNQEFNPTTRLDVNFSFASATAYQNATYNPQTRVNQNNIISNATLSKRWEGTPHSLRANISRTQQTVNNDQLKVDYDNLPLVSFSRQQTFPFAAGGSQGDETWYELIGFSYNGEFRNAINQVPVSAGSTSYKNLERQGMRHGLPLSASPRLGYFSVTPFFNYSELWYDHSIRRSYNAVDSSLMESDVGGFQRVGFFSTGLNVRTKLYGIIQPGIFGIRALRHQLEPAITYNLQPDFSKPSWGYYGTYTDAQGKEQKYSYFEKELYGGAPAGEQQALGLSLGNVFEMKSDATDSTGEEKKYRLLNLTAALAYNFAADSLRFSELSLGYNTSIVDFTLSGGVSYNLYQWVQDPLNPLVGRRLNKFLVKETGQLAQLTSFSIAVSKSFSGEKRETSAGPVLSAQDSIAREELSGGYPRYSQNVPPDFSIPWRLDLSWNFSQSQPNPAIISRSSNLAAQLSFNLTELWKFETSTSYDIVRKEFVFPRVSIYRDLHCWEMSFSWEPLGPYRNFRLEIRPKSPTIRDVKVTKTDRSGGF